MRNTKIIELRCKGLCARVDPTHGATCTELYDAQNGIRVLYPSENPFINGIPILFPANRIAGGRFCAGGHTYTLPINEEKTGCALHGTMNALPFETVSREESRAWCKRDFCNDYPGFPQSFRVDLIYELTENALHQTLRVKNRSPLPLPLLFGFHTTFAVPFCQGSSVQDIRIMADVDRVIERGSDNLPTHVKEICDDYSRALQRGEAPLTRGISRHYRAGTRGETALLDTRTGVLIRYETDPAFRYRMIFTANHEQYLCMEPQICAVNAPNAPLDEEYTHVPLLSQNETAEFRSVISILKADSSNKSFFVE
jgi:aldose 1-epimerase